MREIDRTTEGLKLAIGELHAAQDFFSEAMSTGMDVDEAASLLKDAKGGFEKAASEYGKVQAEAKDMMEQVGAAEGAVESSVGALDVAIEMDDPEAIAEAAQGLAAAAGTLKETLANVPDLSADEQAEIDGYFEESGVTDAKTRKRMAKRFGVLLSGSTDRDPGKAIDQLGHEDGYTPRRAAPSWTRSEAERKG